MYRSFIVVVLYMVCYGNIAAQDSLLVALDKAMAQHDHYDGIKKERIAELQRLAKEPGISPQEVYSLNDHLILEYLPYKFSTALNYITTNISLAKKINDPIVLAQAQLHLAGLLSASGNYTEARELLIHIDPKKLTTVLLGKYYYEQFWLYNRLRFYTPLQEAKERYMAAYHAYADSLQSTQQPGTEIYLTVESMRYDDSGNFLKSREANLKRLALATPGKRPYSSIAFFLAQSYKPQKNMQQYKHYLMLSAISDIKAATKDNAALTDLAIQLFKENDLERAHRYINFAFDDASFYNSRLRLASVSSILPIINKAYETGVQRQKAKLQRALTIISVLSVLLLVMVFFIWRQVRSLTRARKKLQEVNESLKELNNKLQHTNTELQALYDELSDTNRVKEYYIGTLLNLCSEYLDKLDAYRKTVKKMIIGRQVPELLEKTKSGQLIDDEIEMFYKNFDTIFLHIYPDFVDRINDLLLAEERLVVKNGELLTTELRIFALIRLGITDSSRIAKLLRYSVNTIYNYRVKIKNKAAGSREDFEVMVSKIGAFYK